MTQRGWGRLRNLPRMCWLSDPQGGRSFERLSFCAAHEYAKQLFFNLKFYFIRCIAFIYWLPILLQIYGKFKEFPAPSAGQKLGGPGGGFWGAVWRTNRLWLDCDHSVMDCPCPLFEVTLALRHKARAPRLFLHLLWREADVQRGGGRRLGPPQFTAEDHRPC